MRLRDEMCQKQFGLEKFDKSHPRFVWTVYIQYLVSNISFDEAKFYHKDTNRHTYMYEINLNIRANFELGIIIKIGQSNNDCIYLNNYTDRDKS